MILSLRSASPSLTGSEQLAQKYLGIPKPKFSRMWHKTAGSHPQVDVAVMAHTCIHLAVATQTTHHPVPIYQHQHQQQQQHPFTQPHQTLFQPKLTGSRICQTNHSQRPKFPF